MTLRERFNNHSKNQEIQYHYIQIHDIRPKLDYILDNTKFLYQTQNKLDLTVFEALHTYNQRPKINENIYDIFCLKLSHRHS